MSVKIYGVDVSTYQGWINWPVVADALKKVNGGNEKAFVIVRAGFGNSTTQEDKQFKANYDGAKAAGLPVGAYWYSYASGPTDAQREAQACIKVLNGRKFDYPIWYDIEYEPVIINQSKESRTACCKAFCEEIKKAGYKTGIYCSRDFITSKLNYAELEGYDLWVAAYTGGNNPGAVPIPYDMWQYSSRNQLNIPGFGKSLDCNIAYKDYVSDEEDGEHDMDLSADTYKIGPVSTGDRAAMENIASTLGLGSFAEGDYIIIGPASEGDRKQVVALATVLGLSVEPYVEEKPEQTEQPEDGEEESQGEPEYEDLVISGASKEQKEAIAEIARLLGLEVK